jgi:hypothetical protein
VQFGFILSTSRGHQQSNNSNNDGLIICYALMLWFELWAHQGKPGWAKRIWVFSFEDHDVMRVFV